jgi:hypothetical protein
MWSLQRGTAVGRLRGSRLSFEGFRSSGGFLHGNEIGMLIQGLAMTRNIIGRMHSKTLQDILRESDGVEFFLQQLTELPLLYAKPTPRQPGEPVAGCTIATRPARQAYICKLN